MDAREFFFLSARRCIGMRLNLNPALNAPECGAAGRAGKARGGRRIAPCNDEQRSQRALQPCNRMRSGLTQKVRFDKGEKIIRVKTFWEELSGQLPDLG